MTRPTSFKRARIQGGTVLLKFVDVADRTVAETFRGKDVLIDAAQAVKLPKGEFYWHQVIGLAVDDATTQTSLGHVSDILETGANDVYVVRTAQHGELLIPGIKDVVRTSTRRSAAC